jgi:hypothetical protein
VRQSLRRVGWEVPPGVSPVAPIRLILDHPITEALVAYWRFGAGAPIQDLLGIAPAPSALVGTAAYANSVKGPALNFDGSTNYVDVPYTAALNPASFTLFFTFMPTLVDSAYHMLGGQAGDATNANQSYNAYINSGNTLSLYNRKALTFAVVGVKTLTANVWYSGAFTVDGAHAKVYLNGDLDTSTAYSSSFQTATGQNATTGGSQWYAGALGAFGLCNRALTDAEILQVHLDPFCMFEPAQRRARWTFVGITTGYGAAAGTGVVTGVGASTLTVTGVGSAAGTGTVAGVGASTFAAVGSASGTASVTGVGASTLTVTGVGSAAGTGVVVGVGASAFAGVGSAASTGVVTGVGASTSGASGIGLAAGTGNAVGVGSSWFSGVGSAAGTGAAVGVGAGTSSGTGVGSAASTGVVVGVGASTSGSAGVGSATSTGVAVGVGASRFTGVGASSGTGVVTGVGAGGGSGPVTLPGFIIRPHLLALVSYSRR